MIFLNSIFKQTKKKYLYNVVKFMIKKMFIVVDSAGADAQPRT